METQEQRESEWDRKNRERERGRDRKRMGKETGRDREKEGKVGKRTRAWKRQEKLGKIRKDKKEAERQGHMERDGERHIVTGKEKGRITEGEEKTNRKELKGIGRDMERQRKKG